MWDTEQGARSRLDKIVDRARPAEACERPPVPAVKFGRRASERGAIEVVPTEEQRLWMALLAGK